MAEAAKAERAICKANRNHNAFSYTINAVVGVTALKTHPNSLCAIGIEFETKKEKKTYEWLHVDVRKVEG